MFTQPQHDQNQKRGDATKPAPAGPTLATQGLFTTNRVWRSLALRPLAFQPKLTVSRPGHAYEQEADRVAEQVTASAGALPQAHTSGPRLQRACACGGSCPKCSGGTEEGEGVRVQTKPTGGAGSAQAEAPPAVTDTLRSPGTPLEPDTRAFMESRFGHNFNEVRVFTGERATESARAMNALAYTVGRDIVFGAGQYAPETHAGRKLLAHELTHVAQQRAGSAPNTAQRQRAARPSGCEGLARTQLEEEIKERTNKRELRPLFISLKKMRVCFVPFTEADFLTLVADNTSFYESLLKKIWAESQRPFAGYVASGFDPSERFSPEGMRERFGYTLTEGQLDEGAQARMNPEQLQELYAQTDILVFSGHQYAQYRAPGVWTDDDGRGLDVSRITQPLKGVKLLVSTSCATICKEAGEAFKTLFPNAIILGFKKSAPMDGSIMARAFAKKLPKDLLLEEGMGGVAQARDAWTSAAQEKFKEGHSYPGWLDLGSSAMQYWDDHKWVSLNWNDETNKCAVKGRLPEGYVGPETQEEKEAAGTFQREALVVAFAGAHHSQLTAPGKWLVAGGLDFDVSKNMPMDNVRVVFGAGAALVCKEAAEILSTLFPNATLLGFRGSAPPDGPTLVRDFTHQFRNFSWLETATGVGEMVSQWKTHTAASKTGASQPGWVELKTGALEFWDGSTWTAGNAREAAHACPTRGRRAAAPAPDETSGGPAR